MSPRTVAVIDIGSNSGRVTVLRLDESGAVEPLAEARVPLRLVRGVDRDGALEDQSVEHALRALADFRAVATGAGVDEAIAVATAAVREASNGPLFVRRIANEIRLEIRILDGAEEARYAAVGAIHDLDCDDGLLVDVGGGSMQLAQFQGRQVRRTWSLPLGALRLSDAFLTGDPPSAAELSALHGHVQDCLSRADVPDLSSDAVLVGTGGTIRNLARIDRKATDYPIPHVHGYELSLSAVKQIVDLVAGRSMHKRGAIPGLNEDRTDSIVGGAVIFQALMDAVNAPMLLVSGQGLREGLGYGLLAPTMPGTDQVRHGALLGLARRFATWDRTVAERRKAIASAVYCALEPSPDAKMREALESAALVLDIGRSVDYYRRFTHASDIVRTANLAGWSHRAVALLAATLWFGGGDKVRLKPFAPLLARADKANIERAAATLALADHLEGRTIPGSPLNVNCERRQGGVLHLSVPLIAGGSLEGVQKRFENMTKHGLELVSRGTV